MKNHDELRSISKGLFSHVKFSKLIELAKSTIGTSDEVSELKLKYTLSTYKHYEDIILNCEEKIKSLMLHVKTNITSIPGMGVMSAASILGEYGDINNFSSPNKLLSFAGLEPSINESGTQNFKGKMVKHGSSYLRYTLMTISQSMLVNNSEFYEYYLKKRNKVKLTGWLYLISLRS